ncbi:MAG TPA: hypothetical protein VFP72_07535 [Kineosporiaceae bacterium]|nr:hypothetical protein [Kineosporiaceae bacterium]
MGHGSVLARRYRLEERLRVSASGSLWRAFDETLEREVQVRLLDPAAPRTSDVMDAARRTTLARDARLAQILDVGSESATAYIVIENLPGKALSQTVSGAPLPAMEARRLVGEAALGLSRAADQGLHHLRLTPESFIIGPDGSVKVTGTAVEAAATGTQSRDAAAAAQADAVGLVSVLYAALTGRWPGTASSNLPPAPRIGGQPVAPVDLVPGVPPDLNLLCTSTLGSGVDGAMSPAEVADRLRPWSATHPLTDPRGLQLPPEDAPGAAASIPASIPATAPASIPEVVPVPASAPAAVPVRGRADLPRDSSYDLRQELLDHGPVHDHGVGPLAAEPAPGPQPVHRFGGWHDLSAIGTPVPDEEPLVPFSPALPIDNPPQDQSRLVLAVLGVFVVVVVVVAALSLRNLGSPTDLLGNDITRPLPTSSATSTPAATARHTSAPVTSPPTAQPSPSASPQIVGAEAIDPQGDGQENNDQAARAVDGDTSTSWKSNHYATADFAGLKSGVGLVIKLASGSSAVQQVTVDVAGSGGAVELRTTPGPGVDGSTVVATAPIESGHAVLTPDKPVDSQLLLLWFTKLPKANGKYQLIVSEINVR